MLKHLNNLPSEYSAEFDNIDKDSWYKLLDLFDDANIYQTWAYEEVRHGRKNMSHFILKNNNKVVAISQARILKVPLLKMGMAYIRWGPLWILRDTKPDLDIFRHAVRALANEYVLRRNYVLRLRPILFEHAAPYSEVLMTEGYDEVTSEGKQRTFLLSLKYSMDELRQNTNKQWRRHLKLSEQNGFNIVTGTADEQYDALIRVYEAMLDIKRFDKPNDIHEFRLIQQRLPEHLKMNTLLCYSNGEPCAAALCTTMGNSAMNIYRATNGVGRNNNASYFLQWKVLEWAKHQRSNIFNVNGVNPERNPGTFSFKAGLCGKKAADVRYIGVFDCCPHSILSHIMKVIQMARFSYKHANYRLATFLNYLSSLCTAIVPGFFPSRSTNAK